MLSLDGDEEFVEIPEITQSVFPRPESSGEPRAELATPVSDRLVGDRNPAFRQEILEV